MKKFTLFFATLLISMSAFAVNITGGTKFYLKPNSNWKDANAWFAAYFCNGTSAATWVEMNLVENGIYEVTVPSGHSHKNVIFCRMNPEKTTLDWSSKWNQTADLTWDGSANLCAINEGQWDCGTNVEWSTYTPPTEPIVHSYTLAGDNESLFGTTWNPGNTSNDLVDNGDGIWSKTYDDVVFAAPTTIEFKVCLDHAWDQSWGENGNNASATISEAGTYDVTFTFTLSTKKTVVTATKQQTIDPGEDPTPEPDVHTYTLAGDNVSLFGTAWSPENTSNDLVDNGDGTWSKTYDDVVFAASTTIKFKVCLDHAWTTSWGENGGDSDASYTISEAGTYDVTFTFTLETKKTTVTATKQQTIDPGEDPTPEPDPEPTTYTVYFDNNGTGWTTVKAYCWTVNPIVAWPGEAMTPVEGHPGFFSYTTMQSYENIIFNNGSGIQTDDLKVPTDGKNCYNGKTNTWSVYEAPDPSKPTVRFTNLTTTAQLGATVKPVAEVENIENPTFVYKVSYEGGEAITLDENGYSLNDYGVYEFTVVATGDNDVIATATFTVTVELVAVLGSKELCHGYYWERAKENAMYPVDGIYTITYKDVPAGTYEFKVAFGISTVLGIDNIDAENSTPGFSGINNISFTLSEVTDIKISYNPETGKVTLEGVGLEQFGEFVATSYTLCGSAAIFEDEFNTTLTANDMVETSTGVWTKTYSNVVLEARNYYYKVAANYAWNVGQYPASGDAILDIKEAGKYNLTFTFEPNKAEGEKLTVEIQPLAAPVVTLTESAYFVDNFEVVVTCVGKDVDTKVYYQVGEAEALEYTAESVKITETSTIKAWSERYGQKSEVVVATYTKLNQPQLPESATFEDTKEIVITGEMVKYTLNGGEVKDYTAPFTIAETTIVVAWAQAGDVKTAEVSVTYTKQEVVVPEGPKVVTIAEFLAAEVNAEVWYELTGVITNIANTTYGNFDITDETGTVYVYGLTATQVESNDKSFASLGLAVNDTVTIRSVRGEHKGTPQGGGQTTPAYLIAVSKYVAPEGGETPEPEPDPEQPEALVEYVDEQGRIVYPFANAPGFNSWSSSYAEHVVEYNDATVTFEKANKQNDDKEIYDIPVTKGKYVQLTLKDATKAITSVRLVCRKWGSKAQTITLNAGVSEAGLDATEVTSSNFVLETNELPTNSTVIRFTFSTDNQIGIDSIYYTVADKVAVAIEQPTVSVVGGEKYEAFDVELACATVDAKVYYTLNGGEKTEYTAPIKISATTELKTWAELGENVSEAIVVNYTFPAEVADIAALIADETSKNVRIAATLTVIAQTGKYLWVEDASMSMLVYGEAPVTYKNGDQLTGLVGIAADYNGAKQITPAYFPEAATGTPVEPTVMALLDVTAATVHQYIKLEGVTYTNATTLAAGDNTLAMYNRFGYTYAGEEGDKVDVIAIAGLYNETVQVYPISIEKVATVEPTTFTVYFDNNGTNWSKVNAYCWTADPIVAWPGAAMTPVAGHDGFYSYTTATTYENIIFNDGSTQTADLKVPTDGKNCYSFLTKTWSVYTAPVEGEPIVAFTNLNPTAELGSTIKPEATAKNIENPTYTYTVSYEGGEAIDVNATVGYTLEKYGSYVFTVVATGDKDKTATATYVVKVNPIAVVAGVSGLCHGEGWSTTSVKNAMYPVNGVYTITYENVPAGDYEFKVVYEGVWYGKNNYDAENSTPGATGTDNIGFTLGQPTTITILFNGDTKKITLVGEGIDQFGVFIATSYTLCGSAEIFGEADAPTLTDNDMTETAEGSGIWTKTYENIALEAEEYTYKVAANHDWNAGQYPAGANSIWLSIAEAGNYNLTFTYEPNKVEGEKLTCVVEKINQGPITEVENGTIANIYTQNGLIVVEGECQIFTITGQNVTQMNGNLIRGVYIVRTANATSKVIIK